MREDCFMNVITAEPIDAPQKSNGCTSLARTQYMPLPLLTPIEVHQPPASTPKRLIYSTIAPSKGLHLVLEAIASGQEQLIPNHHWPNRLRPLAQLP